MAVSTSDRYGEKSSARLPSSSNSSVSGKSITGGSLIEFTVSMTTSLSFIPLLSVTLKVTSSTPQAFRSGVMVRILSTISTLAQRATSQSMTSQVRSSGRSSISVAQGVRSCTSTISSSVSTGRHTGSIIGRYQIMVKPIFWAGEESRFP